MFERGKIVLVPFPFTDLSSQKVRPAVIVSNPKYVSDNVIVVFVTSKIKKGLGGIAVSRQHTTFPQTGLKIDSVIRCDKIATLDKRIVLGEIGKLPKELVQKLNKTLGSTLGLSQK